MRHYNEQEKEIETIKPRNYSLNLSDADVERIAYKAAEYHLTVSKLLENFIGDLVGGTYSNGSDEQMLANQWAERCWFSYCLDSERNLISYLTSGLSVDFHDLHEILESINAAQQDIEDAQQEIKTPRADWGDIVRYSTETNSYVSVYHSKEEYVSDIREDLETYEDALRFAEDELSALKKDFAEYMEGCKYSWDDELKNAEEWYKANVTDKLEGINSEDDNRNEGNRKLFGR